MTSLSTVVLSDTLTRSDIEAIVNKAPALPASEVETLITHYNGTVEHLSLVAAEMSEDWRVSALTSLCYGYNGQSPNLNIGLNTAKLNQLSSSWEKIFKLVNVRDLMSTETKEQLDAQIKNPEELPPFDMDHIGAVVRDLYSRTSEFFIDSVDYLFQNLSKAHVTNQPNGFYTRMIYSDGVYGKYGDAYRKIRSLIHDLRRCVARLLERDSSLSMMSTDCAITYAEKNYGDWTPIDAGAIHIKCFLNGNIHVRVHPDVAFLLNGVLAAKYPTAIPAKKRSRADAKAQAKKKDWSFSYMEDYLPTQVINYLSSLEVRKEYKETGYRQRAATGDVTISPKSYGSEQPCKETMKIVKKVMGYISASPRLNVHGRPMEGYWTVDAANFTNCGEDAVKNILSKIVSEGCIPNFKSYQYYPTPAHIVEKAIEVSGIKAGEIWGEFSAGQGAIVGKMLETGAYVKAVEVSKMQCAILEEKYPAAETLCADFMKADLSYKFDGFIINPPYANKRWLAHTQKAIESLKAGKVGVAVLPGGYKNSLVSCDEFGVEEIQTYYNDFENTGVTTALVKITKK